MLIKEILSNKNKGFTLFLDIDGVLADYDKGISKLIGRKWVFVQSPYNLDQGEDHEVWDAVKKAYDERGYRHWYELDLMPDAMKLWNYVKEYKPEMLSNTGKLGLHLSGVKQKKDWVKKYFGDGIKVNVTSRREDKVEYARPNTILIDDMVRNIDRWRDAGGIGIVHTSADESISELKKLGL